MNKQTVRGTAGKVIPVILISIALLTLYSVIDSALLLRQHSPWFYLLSVSCAALFLLWIVRYMMVEHQYQIIANELIIRRSFAGRVRVVECIDLRRVVSVAVPGMRGRRHLFSKNRCSSFLGAYSCFVGITFRSGNRIRRVRFEPSAEMLALLKINAGK